MISGSAVVARDARRVVRQELRLDVARDEEVAAQRVHAASGPARANGTYSLTLNAGDASTMAADARRVVVHPRGHQHRADALRDARRCPRPRCRAAAPMWSTNVCTSRTERRSSGESPRAPGERPWPRASHAKKSKSGRSSSSTRCAMRPECSWPRWNSTMAPRAGAVGRRPVAVEELDAVVRAERALRATGAQRSAVSRRVVHRRRSLRAEPARATRLTMVTTQQPRASDRHQPGGPRRQRRPRGRSTGRARRRRTRGRSCPSGRRSGARRRPCGPSTPANSEITASTITTPRPQRRERRHQRERQVERGVGDDVGQLVEVGAERGSSGRTRARACRRSR